MKIVIRRYARGIEIDAPYDADLVRALKENIHPKFRRWDKRARVWSVYHPLDHDAYLICCDFGEVEYSDLRVQPDLWSA